MAKKLGGFEFWKETLGSAEMVVAPMVDQSELAWRLLSRRYGAQLCYTPMLHACVFNRDEKYRREALATCPEDRPLIVQFCANDPADLLKAAQSAEDHCDAIDLNLGCPQMIAKRGHYGAFLQDEWELLHEMISTCHEKLKVPITVKIRVFEEIDKTVSYARMLEKAGCQLLTVHGRRREQKGTLTGLASWKHIKAVRESVNIPVFANGNIQYLPDVHRCIQATGVQGVMIAEGNLHNPALFKGLQPPVWDIALEYLDIAEKYSTTINLVRSHLFKIFQHSFKVHTTLRDQHGKCKTIEAVRELVLRLKEHSMEDVNKYEKDPAAWQSDLPFPYWICQPYVRPDPDNPPPKKESLKRPLLIVPNGSTEELSKNKLKKRVRNPTKNFIVERRKFEVCVVCGNPKSLKCEFDRCKRCCKKKLIIEVLDCPGHNLKIKSNVHKRALWEQEQKDKDKVKEHVHIELDPTNATCATSAPESSPNQDRKQCNAVKMQDLVNSECDTNRTSVTEDSTKKDNCPKDLTSVESTL